MLRRAALFITVALAAGALATTGVVTSPLLWAVFYVGLALFVGALALHLVQRTS